MIIEVDPKNRELFSSMTQIIRISNETVARDFNFTKENAPGHTSFMTEDKLRYNSQYKRYFLSIIEEENIGCIILEKSQKNDNEYFIESLSVLPQYRHRGYGESMIKHLIDVVYSQNGKKISIGLIDENSVLKKWYLKQGFKITGTKKFTHLPFTVCFMDYIL